MMSDVAEAFVSCAYEVRSSISIVYSCGQGSFVSALTRFTV